MLKTRVITGACLTVAVLAALYGSVYYPVIIHALAALLAFGAAWEVFGVCGSGHKNAWFYICAAAAIVIPFLSVPWVLCGLAALTGYVWLWIESRDLLEFFVPQALAPILMSLLASVMFSAFPLLCAKEHGVALLLLAFVVCVLTDTMAYFIGSKWGKHRLAPKTSPKKSIEGAVGGTVIAMALGTAYCYAAASILHTPLNLGRAISYTLLASAAGQLGDLSLSVMKRIAGVKDYGNTFPGHGGVLDRFDSMLFCAPVTLVFVTLLPIF